MVPDTIKQVGAELWIDTEGEGELFALCDSTGGRTLIDYDELPALIVELHKLVPPTPSILDVPVKNTGRGFGC